MTSSIRESIPLTLDGGSILFLISEQFRYLLAAGPRL